MIAKLNDLKSKTQIAEVQVLCETTMDAISSVIYNGVTQEARIEIERVTFENLFEELAKYPEDKVISEWLANQKRLHALNHLGVRKAVTFLIETEAKHHDTLAMILDDFREKLDNTPEILLYEEFISALSGFNYLSAVNTELEAVADRVSKYKNDIGITKILEVMKSTRSNYLLPYIEDVVENYLNNKTMQTKSSLKEALVKFSYDPFVQDIINLLILDATDLQLEYSNSACAIEDKLFSPILYLGENETMFNIKGSYYVKKGNYINKIKNEEIEKIDENFKGICEVLILPGIEISKKDIKIYIGDDNAVLNETETYINSGLFTKEQISESAKIAQWSGNTQFYSIVNLLRENFNEIAELDFVKRVYLIENENYAADVFKLRENIYITTFDPLNNKATFYRNINPIQAEKVMMEHMRFDVSKTFANILPNKEKILAEIESTKIEYSNYINELVKKISEFKLNPFNTEVTEQVIDALNEELEEVKTDYKDYLNEVEKFTTVVENLIVTVQDDQTNQSHTVVIPSGPQSSKGEFGSMDATGVEGNEFGTEVGMSSLPTPDSPSSAITFDDDQAELLSDAPGIEDDEVNLGADEIEAKADVMDAEKDVEGVEEPGEEGEGEELLGDLGDTEAPKPDEDELNLGGDEEKDVELETPEEEEPPQEETVAPPEKELEKVNFQKDKNPNDLQEPQKVSNRPKKVFLKRPKK